MLPYTHIPSSPKNRMKLNVNTIGIQCESRNSEQELCSEPKARVSGADPGYG